MGSEPAGSKQHNTSVCLLQAVRLPGLHGKLVRARVAEKGDSSSYCFEPSEELEERGVLAPDAALEPDADGHVVIVLENHKPESVVVGVGGVGMRLPCAEVTHVINTGNHPIHPSNNLQGVSRLLCERPWTKWLIR